MITLVYNLHLKFWVDNKLRWDPNEYGGLKEIRLPHDKIWKPVIIKYEYY